MRVAQRAPAVAQHGQSEQDNEKIKGQQSRRCEGFGQAGRQVIDERGNGNHRKE
ncbi:MAG TPA: hypothetical protein PKH77_16520 [Anaerolineae bacterium]|nr:hypothetical protein [Anaerolineae bacterium]